MNMKRNGKCCGLKGPLFTLILSKSSNSTCASVYSCLASLSALILARCHAQTQEPERYLVSFSPIEKEALCDWPDRLTFGDIFSLNNSVAVSSSKVIDVQFNTLNPILWMSFEADSLKLQQRGFRMIIISSTMAHSGISTHTSFCA